MKIVIVGGGSIGLLIGSFFSESGFNVTLLVRRIEQQELLKKSGICRIHIDGSQSIHPVSVITSIDEAPGEAIWIVATKYQELEEVIHKIEVIRGNCPLLFIQNGIGHLEIATRSLFTEIALATVEHGAKRLNDYTVQHNGIGMITIAHYKGEAARINSLIRANSKHFPLVISKDVEQVMLRKVLLNCMINPLTTILQITNGELLSNPFANKLLMELYNELIEAFPYMKASLPFEAVENLCEKTAMNQSSMLSDRLNGRKMEIYTIVTAVIKKGTVEGVELPLLEMLEKLLLSFDWRINET